MSSSKSETNSGRSGRGPTRLISPRSTLNSCGSSSSAVRRMKRPNGVRLSSPSTPPGAEPCSGRKPWPPVRLTRIERNLSMSNTCPSRPTRRWRNSTGPAGQLRAERDGDQGGRQEQHEQGRGRPIDGVLDRELPALGIHRAQREQGKAAEVVERHALVDPLVETRHERHLQPEPVAPPPDGHQ